MDQKRIEHTIKREKRYIELLADKDLSCHGHWDMGYHQGRLSVLENMEEEVGPWIPVTERLPEPEDGWTHVLVSMDDGFVATTDYTVDDGFELWADSGEVVAWMPLPEPYRPDTGHGKGE